MLLKEKFNSEIKVSKEVILKLNECLEKGKITQEIVENETIFIIESTYKNDFKFVLKVYVNEGNLMCTAYLYDNYNELIRTIESNDSICESYGFELENTYFEANIKQV